jgi:hypothetical protein
MRGELRGLFAKFRDGGSFPQMTFARGTDGVNRARGVSGKIDERAVRVHVEAEEESVRAREALSEKPFNQRRVHAAAIGFRASAVDDAIDVQHALVMGLALAEGNFGVVAKFAIVRDSASVQSGLSVAQKSGDGVTDLGSHAMAIGVPVGAQVAQESAAFVERERLPNLLRGGTKSVDDGAPVDASVGCGAELAADKAQEAASGARTLLTPKQRPGTLRSMRLRQQAAARKHMNVSGEALRFESEGDVDAGQAGTDEQDAAILRNVLQRRGRPRMRNVAFAVIGEPADVQVRRREVPDGQYDEPSDEDGAVFELNVDAGGLDGEGRDFVLKPLKVAGAALDGFVEQRGDVAAVTRARKKISGLDGGVVIRLRPAEEVIRFVGEGAHAGGGNVEQMAGMLGAIGDAAARRGRFVDDGDGESRVAAQQLRGDDRAAEAASDDYHVERGVAQREAFPGRRRQDGAGAKVGTAQQEQSGGHRDISWHARKFFVSGGITELHS